MKIHVIKHPSLIITPSTQHVIDVPHNFQISIGNNQKNKPKNLLPMGRVFPQFLATNLPSIPYVICG